MMSTPNRPDAQPLDDDDGGYEGPDIETSPDTEKKRVESEPVIDPDGDDELLDSADSFVSPARTDESQQQ